MSPSARGRRPIAAHGLTVLLDAAALSDAEVAALYRAVPDTTVVQRNGRVTVAVDRVAADLPAAVVSAIGDIEAALPGTRVRAIEHDDLVSQSDIAQRRSRSRESISQLVQGERGPGGFPLPRFVVSGRGLWRWPEVEAWFDAYEGRAPQARHDGFFDAVNGLLAVRLASRTLAEVELRAVRRLAAEEALLRA